MYQEISGLLLLYQFYFVLIQQNENDVICQINNTTYNFSLAILHTTCRKLFNESCKCHGKKVSRLLVRSSSLKFHVIIHNSNEIKRRKNYKVQTYCDVFLNEFIRISLDVTNLVTIFIIKQLCQHSFVFVKKYVT